MIATNEKYSDGRIVYLHDCPKCGIPNSARGTRNKPTQCDECLLLARRANAPSRLKHGECKTKMYRRWKSMYARCYSEKNPRYSDWGGRGIKICDEWLHSYESYRDYINALPNAHEPGRSVDRRNNDGNYEPGNMKWSTASEQSLNQRPKKTNTGEAHITYNENDRGLKKFRVLNDKRFLTLEEAIERRNEIYEKNRA